MSRPWEIPVPEPVTGWWPTYYKAFGLKVPVSLEIGALARLPAALGLRVPVALEMAAQGISRGDFGLSVPVSLGFSGPPPIAANLVIPAGVRFSVEAADRYARTFGFSVTPRLTVGGTLATLPPTPGRFGLSVAPRLTIAGREYHEPELFAFTASNPSWGIPAWCDAYDEIALGGGGGGNSGAGLNNHGRGGSPGSWASRTVVRGNGAGQLDRYWNTLNIIVGQGTPNNSNGQGSAVDVVGNGGWGVNGSGGIGGGSSNQYGRAPGAHTFNGVKYQGQLGVNPGTADIPASGGNYSGWTGCGDGTLGGIGTGGAGGQGLLVGSHTGGQGCRGQVWVYCYQSQDAANLPPAVRQATTFQGSFTYNNAGGAFPSHAIGDILLVWAYSYAPALPVPPAAGGNVPQWNLIGSPPGGGGALYWGRAHNLVMQTGAWTNCYSLAVAIIRGAHQTAPIGGRAFTNPPQGTTMTAPAVTLRGAPLGTSQIIHFFSSNANSWGTLSAGFTSRQATTYVRMATKNDTTTSTEPSVTGTNATIATQSAASVEIMGASV